MRIYRCPNLHLNANVAVLAWNRGNEEHYSSSATITRLCLVPSREQRELSIQWLGEDRRVLYPKSTPACVFRMLSSFPGDAGMVMDQAIGWDFLATSTTKAMSEGTRGSLLILGRDPASFPKVPASPGTQTDAIPPKQWPKENHPCRAGPCLYLLPPFILHLPPTSPVSPSPSPFLQVITKDIN